jgi:hypothetical protein
VFSFASTLTPKTIKMKKEQFTHNLAKTKRQSEAKRVEQNRMRKLFEDFGNIYVETYKKL